MSKTLHTLKDVVRTLNVIVQTDFVSSMRKRYASPEQWEEESKRIDADQIVNWNSCKHIICEYKNEFDKLILDPMNFSDKERETYKAACLTIEKEAEQVLERTMLGEDDGEN